MHTSVPNVIKSLSLEGLFSKLAASLVSNASSDSSFSYKNQSLSTARTDSAFSNDSALASTRRNHDTQPLHYSSKKQYQPMQSAALSSDVKKHKRMSTLKDKRILR